MRKLIPLLLCLALCLVAVADDRVMTQLRFRKAIWECSCGQVDYTDLNMSGGNTYEHNCSKCGKWTNKFINYSGCLTVPSDKYAEMTAKEIAEAKQDMAEAWKYDHDNPPPYVEPTVAELLQLYNDRVEEATQYFNQFADKATKEELETIKSDFDAKSETVQGKIDEKNSPVIDN